MKKILSVVMAVAMIASMSAVAFAKQPENSTVTTGTGTFNAAKTDAGYVNGNPDGDDNTIKVDGSDVSFPVVSVVGPYGYYADDKVLFDGVGETIHGYTSYAAPIEYGSTAYYALIQYVPKVDGATSLANNYTLFKDKDAADGKQITDVTVATDPKDVSFANDNSHWLTVVTESETVSGLKIKQDWEDGEDLVKSVSIVKKKVCNYTSDGDITADIAKSFEYSGDDSDDDKRPYSSLESLGLKQFGMEQNMYCYFIAVKYEDSTSVNDSDVIGNVIISKSKDPAVDKLEIALDQNLDWENSYRDANNDIKENCTVNGDGTELEAGKNYALKFEADDEVELTFDNDSYFEVDVSGQSKMLFSYNTDYISRIAAKYPYAELNFWNGNGAKFNRVGQMFLSCEDLTGTQFLYQVTSDGKLKEVPGAEWDDSDEGFYFNTRVLGSYVISDMELDTVDEEKVEVNNTVVAPAPVITNPSTGAIA